MKPAVIYFINFFHVSVIKSREREVAKRRLTLISPHFFPLPPLSRIHGDREVALPFVFGPFYSAPINFLRDKNGNVSRGLSTGASDFDCRVGVKHTRENLMANT